MEISLKGARAVLLASLAVAAAPSVHASTLLSLADEAQLASWLGQGALTFTSIYSKAAGDTAANFHLAADGKGATFSVMEATNKAGQTFLVGGYNPRSWSSTSGFNKTPDQKDRTAFLFNLTSHELHTQTPVLYQGDMVGADQTYNAADYGPTFGVGHDLVVTNDMTRGSSWLYSYQSYDHPNQSLSLLDGTPAASLTDITFGRIEVYTISAVPEPVQGLMLLAGGAVLLAMRRRQA